MPRLLEETEVDPTMDALDQAMTADEERTWQDSLKQPVFAGDLSDGGMVGGAKLTPMADGRKLEKGRPAARRAYSWNGQETTLPLAWNPQGTVHDNARRYFLKRFCLCCKTGGFRFTSGRPRVCPTCAHNNCQNCNAGRDTSKVHTLPNGKTVQGWIIPCFYLRKDDVPFPDRFYGNVDCFLETCIRRGNRGFKSEADMRMHARSRHRIEYLGHVESLTIGRNSQIEALQNQVNTLLAAIAGRAVNSMNATEFLDVVTDKTVSNDVVVAAARYRKPMSEESKAKLREYQRKARAARKEKLATIQ